MTSSSDRVRIVPVALPDGRQILAEVTVASSGGDAAAGRRLALETVREDIQQISRFVADTLRQALPDPPDRYGIDFGIKLAVESKGLTSVLAKVAGEATITVRLEWDRGAPTADRPDGSQG